MKKYWKLIVAAGAFVAFMVVVSVVYKNLSAEYKPQQNLVTQNVQGTDKDGGQNMQPSQGTDNDKGQNTKPPQGVDNGSTQPSQDANIDGGSQEADGVDGTQGADATGAGQGTGNADTQSGANASGNTAGVGQDTNGETTENLAPNFTVENAEGEEVSLHDFFGKPIILNFWASWCGPCKMELPDFQDAFEKYDGEIEFLMVNMTDGVQETKEIAMKYMEDEGYTLPVYYDTAQDAAYTYTVYSLPTTFFINADGEAVAYAQGMIDAETLATGISMIYP